MRKTLSSLFKFCLVAMLPRQTYTEESSVLNGATVTMTTEMHSGLNSSPPSHLINNSYLAYVHTMGGTYVQAAYQVTLEESLQAHTIFINNTPGDLSTRGRMKTTYICFGDDTTFPAAANCATAFDTGFIEVINVVPAG